MSRRYDLSEGTGMIEGTRQVMQHFLAPESSELIVRIDALEKRFNKAERRADKRHEETTALVDRRSNEAAALVKKTTALANKRIEETTASLERNSSLVDRRHGEALSQIDRRHQGVVTVITRLADYIELQDRVARSETKDSVHQ